MDRKTFHDHFQVDTSSSGQVPHSNATAMTISHREPEAKMTMAFHPCGRRFNQVFPVGVFHAFISSPGCLG
jgi:hypothetical protein